MADKAQTTGLLETARPLAFEERRGSIKAGRSRMATAGGLDAPDREASSQA